MGHGCVVTHMGGFKKNQVNMTEVKIREVGAGSPE